LNKPNFLKQKNNFLTNVNFGLLKFFNSNYSCFVIFLKNIMQQKKTNNRLCSFVSTVYKTISRRPQTNVIWQKNNQWNNYGVSLRITITAGL
jgi:hypothetical protein